MKLFRALLPQWSSSGGEATTTPHTDDHGLAWQQDIWDKLFSNNNNNIDNTNSNNNSDVVVPIAKVFAELQTSTNLDIDKEEFVFVFQKLTKAMAKSADDDDNGHLVSRAQLNHFLARLDNRIALTIYFDKYKLPVLERFQLRQLRQFFQHEQSEHLSDAQCRALMARVSDNGKNLDRNDFYRLLNLDTFDIFNPVHRAVCQDMDKPITYYFVLAAGHLGLPSPKVTTTLAKHYPTESMATVEDMMVLRYRYLLEQCYRYFALPIIVLDKVSQLAVAIVNTAHKHVGLDKVLATVQSFAFRNSNYPVILNLQLAKDFDQFEVLRAALEDNLASYNTLQGEFTPKQMTNKVLVYFTVVPQQQDFEHLVVGNLLAKGGEQNGQLEVDVDNFEDLYANKDKLTTSTIVSLHSKLAQEFIESCTTTKEKYNYWPELTRKTLVTSSTSGTSREMLNMLRVGIQLIVTKDDDHRDGHDDEVDCHRAMFTLNGGCGYLLKPQHLYQGKLYGLVNNSLKNEVAHGIYEFAVTFLSAQNVTPPPGGATKMVVKFQVLGHREDEHHFTTGECCVAGGGFGGGGGQTPFWNEQTRFRLRMPNIAFFRFEVQHHAAAADRLVTLGQATMPVKAVLRGVRFVPLLDVVAEAATNNTNNVIVDSSSRLFVRIDYKMLANYWEPSSDDQQQR